jgi:diguanylate cyclase (GGDEF)-like protein
LQVDGYLLKPLDLKLLDNKIKKISENIAFRREYETQKIIMNEIAHLQGSMLAVLNEEFELLFLNDKALAFWGEENIEEAIKHNRMLSSRMVKQEEYFYPSDIEGRHWITEIQLLPPHKRIIALWTPGKEVINTYVVDVTYSTESKHTIISLSEITKMEEEKKLYQKQIYIDELTQIYNRTMFNKQLDIELKRSNAEKSELSMILMDIDHFKQVNDRYGHMVGDEVLVGLTHLIKSKIRTNDLFARWGGEEFVILLPDTDSEGAWILAENLRKMIEIYTFSAGISLTCSFGVAAKKQEDIYLFRKADEALYRAKLNGRNRVVTY